MRNKFKEHVEKWEENELFYKELYNKKNGPQQEYVSYLTQLNMKVLEEKGLVVPDLDHVYEQHDESMRIFTLNHDIAVWKHSRYTPPYYHAHDYFEIICVLSGELVQRIEGQTCFKMKAGNICILPDNVAHSVEMTCDDGICINIMLRKSTFNIAFFDTLSSDDQLGEFFREVLYGAKRKDFLLFEIEDQEDRILDLVRLIYLEYWTDKKRNDKVLLSMLKLMFAYLLRDYDQYCVNDITHNNQLEIVQYLRNNFDTATLESTAKFFNYSTAYLSRLIKKSTGMTFSNIMKQCRMEMACEYLTNSNLQVGKICEIVGYKSLEHFNRLFKEQYQMTPIQYRKSKKSVE